MADLASADIEVEILNRRTKDSGRHNTNAKLSFGNAALTYPTGGLVLDKGDVGCPNVIESLVVYDMGPGGYVWSWDGAAGKLVALQSAEVPAASGGGPAPANPDLGTDLQSFLVLGSTAITNTGSSVVGGDVGISPAGAINGFPPGIITGTTHNGDATAAAARVQLAAALVAFNAMPTTETFAPATVIGTGGTRPVLGPGVYEWATSGQLTGQLTLNAAGDPDAKFVFLMGSTLTTAAASSVVLSGGAQADNVYWVLGSSATIGTGTQLMGNILVQTSITLVTGASTTGRLLAHSGAVTLDSTSLTQSEQAAPAGGGGGAAAGPLVAPDGVAIAPQAIRCEILGW